MILKFHGGAGEVTGINYLLETKSSKIVVDCGLFQGEREEERDPGDFPYDPKEVDFVLITHAHLDHIGRLPQLVNAGFSGKILATAPTIDFAKLMLEDSQKILREKAKSEALMIPSDKNIISRIMSLFEKVEYGEEKKLNKEISVRFQDAGHVLGSASIEVEAEKKKIVFSGDLGSGRLALLRNPEIIENADYLIMESAYGDRIHEEKESSQDILEDIIEETVSRAGVLMIPSFALERTQEILYHLNHLMENKKIPEVPVFLDSPLAIGLTEIYKKYSKYYSEEASLTLKEDKDIFSFPGFKMTEDVNQSKQINFVNNPKVIIAGAGMSQGGRILHHEIRYLEDPKNTLFIVTYQAKGTLGRRILDGAEMVEILGKRVPVNAEIKHISGYSSHADQKDLLNWVTRTAQKSAPGMPKQIFVCQGEQESSEVLAQKIRDQFAIDARVPKTDEAVEL